MGIISFSRRGTQTMGGGGGEKIQNSKSRGGSNTNIQIPKNSALRGWIAGANEIADDSQFLLAGDGMAFGKFVPFDAQTGRFENVNLLAHHGKGDHRVEHAMGDQ